MQGFSYFRLKRFLADHLSTNDAKLEKAIILNADISPLSWDYNTVKFRKLGKNREEKITQKQHVYLGQTVNSAPASRCPALSLLVYVRAAVLYITLVLCF